ncbi:MAG: right-handed parallel beta-helix repeat-containing protein [Thermoplasmata archaeon]|nr:MAG: right-handed parallel beta-helix repeat-containing protein [Thermoplasmata archaeon]
MSRKGAAVLIVSSMLCSFTVIVVEIAPNASAYTPHDPLVIAGDEDFAAQAASEGWPGNGTEGNPYVIEGYEITRSIHHNCIDITSTKVHFIIKDSKIVGNQGTHNIFFNNIRNGQLDNCIIEGGGLGIYVWAGRKNTITNNTLIDNNLLLYNTGECTLIGNEFSEAGIELRGIFPEDWNSHYIDSSNTINGKPVYYWKEYVGGTVPSGAGQIILANCTHTIVENQELTNGSGGIILGYCSNIFIQGNTIHSNNEVGVELWRSSDNTIADNIISSNKQGIKFQHSNNNTIQSNKLISNGLGIWVTSSSGNYIFANIASSNSIGIEIRSWGEHLISMDNTILNNTVINNLGKGISIDGSDENTIKNNIAINNSAGIYLSSSSKNSIIGNIAIDNGCGIQLTEFSDKNRVEGNNLSSNHYGTYLKLSCNNIIHHNNLINNTTQLYREDSYNSWDDGEGEGNYWSNYTGLDDGSGGRTAGDGVGDTELPHEDVDDYPLMEPVDIAEYGESDFDDDTITDFKIRTVSLILAFSILFIIIFVVIFLVMKRDNKR